MSRCLEAPCDPCSAAARFIGDVANVCGRDSKQARKVRPVLESALHGRGGQDVWSRVYDLVEQMMPLLQHTDTAASRRLLRFLAENRDVKGSESWPA